MLHAIVALAVVFNLVTPTAALGGFQLSNLFGLPEAPTEDDHSQESAPFARDIKFIGEEEVDEELDELDGDVLDPAAESSNISCYFEGTEFCNQGSRPHLTEHRLFILFCALKIDL